MRYHATYIGDPADTEQGTLSRTYASDRNALRFMHRHLSADRFPPGQYRLTSDNGRHVGHLYKRA